MASLNLSGCDRGHVNEATPVTPGKVDAPVHQGKKCVVSTTADPRARVKMGAPLAHNDRPSRDRSAIKDLDPQALGSAVAPVSGAPATFCLGHLTPPW